MASLQNEVKESVIGSGSVVVIEVGEAKSNGKQVEKSTTVEVREESISPKETKGWAMVSPTKSGRSLFNPAQKNDIEISMSKFSVLST